MRPTVRQYLETLLWSETLSAVDEDGNPTEVTIPEDSALYSAGETFEDGTPLDNILDVSDLPGIAPDVVSEAEADLEAFAGYVEETLGFDPFAVFDSEQVAHDFCLSRNGHGAGFFDGDYTYEGEQYCQALQSAAKTFGTLGLDLYVAEGASEVTISSHG